MTLHQTVYPSYGSALEATQASALPSRAMTPSLPTRWKPLRDAFGVTEPLAQVVEWLVDHGFRSASLNTNPPKEKRYEQF